MKNSTTNKILALIIAILLWAYVMAVEKPPMTKTIEDIPIQIENEALLIAANMAIAETSELSTGIVLEGQRSDLKKLTVDDISASINVMGYSQGKFLVQVNVKVPDKITVEEVKTPKVQVTIESLVAKSKPVEVSVMNLTEGTEDGAVEIVPQEIEVSGAKSRVNSVASVQVTLDASQLAEKAKTVQLSATAVDGQGMPVDNVRLSAHEVDVTAKLYRTREVDLKVDVIGSPGNGMELAAKSLPTKITIKGPKSELKEINSIEAKPINISGITDNTTIKLEPILPENIEVARVSEDLSASFNLRDIVRKEFTYANNEISIEGLSADYTVSIETPTIRVVVSGPQNIMSSLTKADLAPVVHAGNVDTTTSSLKITVNYNKNLKSISVSPNTVNISVEKAPVTAEPNGGANPPPVPEQPGNPGGQNGQNGQSNQSGQSGQGNEGTAGE